MVGDLRISKPKVLKREVTEMVMKLLFWPMSAS